jgi:hypothetical protein
MFEQLKQMNAELEALKKAHLEKSKLLFTEVSQKVFEAHPKLTSFGWRQYTPYFNDGEECTFSAHTDYPEINDIDGDEVNFKDEFITDYGSDKVNGAYPKIKNESFDPDLNLALKMVKEFLDNIKDEVLRDLFGDHVRVKVTAGGTEVEEYEHD